MRDGDNGFIESADTIHGRLMEGVHIVGYTFERACTALKWLLTDNRWREVGEGFDDINAFLGTIKLTGLQRAVTERKEIARLLADIGASQRATARALDVDDRTVRRDLMPPAANAAPQPRHDKEIDEPIAAHAAPERSKAHVTNNSGEVEWYTPAEYVEAARQTLGQIDLDPASCQEANTVVKALKFYSKEDDALSLPHWRGPRVWMNPPYSNGTIVAFCAKFLQEYEKGHISEAVVLTNNATETGWFHSLFRRAAAFCIPTGRIRFWRPKEPSFTPLQGQVLFYFGTSPQTFCDHFRQFGDVTPLEVQSAD